MSTAPGHRKTHPLMTSSVTITPQVKASLMAIAEGQRSDKREPDEGVHSMSATAFQ